MASKKNEGRKSLVRNIASTPRGIISVSLLIGLYAMMVLSFVATPYHSTDIVSSKVYHPPNFVLWSSDLGFGPQVQEYAMVDSFAKKYLPLKGKYHRVQFFTRKSVVQTNKRVRFFSTEHYPLYIFGSDGRGRDLFSRLLYGSRISLSIGLVGIIISTFLGLIVGGIAGYYGGGVDWALMRICEFIILIPSLYLILFVRGIFLDDMSPGLTYLIITIVLSFFAVPSTARITRGMVHSIKREDFVTAAQLDNMKAFDIVKTHIFPHLSTVVIINMALSIPVFILNETVLSYLGLGITDPSVSWGSLLNRQTLKIQSMQEHPWVLIPGIFLFLTTMAYILLGERLRDVLDPFRSSEETRL